MWGGGIGVALACISLLEHLHKINDWDKTISIAYTTRIATRLIGGVIFVATPLATSLSDISLLGIDASVMVAMVIEESFGKSAIIKARSRTQTQDTEANNLDDGSSLNLGTVTQSHERDQDTERSQVEGDRAAWRTP